MPIQNSQFKIVFSPPSLPAAWRCFPASQLPSRLAASPLTFILAAGAASSEALLKGEARSSPLPPPKALLSRFQTSLLFRSAIFEVLIGKTF